MSEKPLKTGNIVVAAGLPAKVLAEIAGTDFETFRQEEYAHIQTSSGGIQELYTAVFTSLLSRKGEPAAYRGIAGVMFAHRLLRYANGEKSLPPRTHYDLVAMLEAQGKGVEPEGDGQVLHYPEFDERFAEYEELYATVNGLSNAFSQYGAKTLLLFLADEIALPEQP